MSSQASLSVTPAEREDFLAFQRDFEKHFQNLADALAKSNAVGSVASSIEKKGTLSMVWGSLNGDNDKEFAQMAADLAASLGTTQIVLQMVMQLSHRKNGFLRQFHQVLTEKISKLVKDAQILDDNQRDASIVILTELDEHVSAQLAQQELVERHDRELERVERYIAAADLQAGHFTSHFEELETRWRQLRLAENELRALIQEHHHQADASLAEQRNQLADQVKGVARLDTAHAEHAEQLSLLGADIQQRLPTEVHEKSKEALVQEIHRLTIAQTAQEKHITELETRLATMNGMKALFQRSVLPASALVLAAVALLRSM